MKTLGMVALLLAGAVGCAAEVDGTPAGTSNPATGGEGGGAGAPSHGDGGSGAGGGDGATCDYPDAGSIGISPSSLGMCLSHGGGGGYDYEITGPFALTSGGFSVSSGETVVTIEGDSPAIPAGALVHLRYGCNAGYYGDSGGYVLIENEAEIDGVANPVEDGSRLWYFAAVGGEARVPVAFPFKYKTTAACLEVTSSGRRVVERLELEGRDFSVSVEPGADANFTVPSGPEAGVYRAENVAMETFGYTGGDATWSMNFRVTRAD